MAAKCRVGPLTHERLLDTSQEVPMKNLFATSNHFHIKFVVDLLSFRLASGYNTMLHKGERGESKREPTSTHRSQKPPPSQSRLRHTKREATSPPPPKKEKRKLCRSLTGVGTGTGRGEGQGASRGRPCSDRRTEMGRAQQRTDMQLRLLLWRPGWEL